MDKNELKTGASRIIIGREAGKDGFRVDEQYPFVGRRHARIIRNADGIFIEDLESANGTYVNGSRVMKKKITSTDKISLGGADYYELRLESVLKLLPLPDTEFSAKFLHLKKVYDDFVKERTKIQSEGQGKMMIKRSLPMAIPGLISFALAPFIPQAVIFGGILSAGAMVAGSVWASKDMAKIPERMAELQEKFLEDYCCPDCGHSFGQTPWKVLKNQGKCPRCQREWKVG